MASTTDPSASTAPRPVEATVVGSTIQTPPVREQLTHADPAPLHEVPKDSAVEATLARAESLLGRGQFGAALTELAAIKPGIPPLASRYAFLHQEKLSRAQIGIAQRYVARGDPKNARSFYERALQADAADAAVRNIATVAAKAFDELMAQRATLIDGMTADISKNDFTQWCGRKKALGDLTFLDVAGVRERIYPDFRLEDGLGERPPIATKPGYVDPLPVETDLVAFTSAAPGAIFRAVGDAAVDVDAPQAGVPGDPPGNRVRASLALPVLANVLTAKLGLFALEQGLNVTGQAEGSLPLFRYEHLRDRTRALVADIQAIETRMLPIQFALDDFAQLVDAVRRPLEAQQAELAALNQKISELSQTLAQLTQVKQALDTVVIALDKAQDECDCDWFCWLVSILADAFITALAAAVVISLAIAADPVMAGLIIAYGVPIAVGAGTATFIDVQTSFTCENVGEIGRSMHASLSGVQAAIVDTAAELQHALARRDVLIASINALSQQLDAIYQSNAARLLDAKTLDAIQAQYNGLRQLLLTRAQATAKLAQDAFNFERDADVRLIKDAYLDPSLKGYTAAETLLADLGGLDHVDLTGRTLKPLQLSQMVSLRKHSPVSFIALAATRTARFTTTLADFDRWYPGTYLQRLKEVRVEVLVDGEAVPARGYLSNDGVSLVRFVDSGNTRPVDNTRIFAEPDPDIARLCYKRLQRRRHLDTMAFPAFASDLYDARQRSLQERERNVFENVGLESTWLLELLPDQPFDLGRIGDVRVWFQFEALFDDNLKRLLEAKRQIGRREMAALAIGARLRADGEPVDFTGPLAFTTTRDLFEGPSVDKTIVNAGVALRLKGGRKPGGPAAVEVAFEGAAPVTVTTTDAGVAATATDHPAGGGLDALAAMVHGKSIKGSWTVQITHLPPGTTTDDVDELFLLLYCEYAS